MKKLPTIALGTWSWGTGAAGGDQVFGNHLEAENLKPVFEEAMKNTTFGILCHKVATVGKPTIKCFPLSGLPKRNI